MSDGRPPEARADSLHELLPWYVNGTLGAAEATSFREHLEGCETCRSEMTFLEKLRAELGRHGGAFLEDHPSAERLVARVRGELDAEQARTIDRHLALCVTCTTEMRWITGSSIADAPTPSRGHSLSWSFRSPWVAAAAAGLAGFLIATFVWNVGTTRDPAVGSAPPVTFISSNVRQVDRPNLVELADGHDIFLLAARTDVDADALPGLFTIVDGTGEVVRRGIVTADALTQNHVFIDCRRADFPDGVYRLELDLPGVDPFFFDFTVVAKRPDS